MATVVRDLLAQREDLPPVWRDADTGEPNPRAQEELAWSLVHHTLDHLLYGDPLPSRVRVGREQVSFDIKQDAWDSFAEELGLGTAQARRHLTDAMVLVLRREPLDWITQGTSLPCLAAGLVFLLDGFSRHARGGRRSTPRQGTLGFDGSIPGQEEALESVNELIMWAGEAGTTPENRYRVAFHVVWRPLSRRSWRDLAIPAESVPKDFSLPVDFLERARTSHGDASVPDVQPTRQEPETQATSVPSFREPVYKPSTKEAGDGPVAVLKLLLEPLLSLRKEPAVLVEMAESSANGLAADVLRAWRRALLSPDLELYGAPGSVVVLKLPDRAWRLAEGPFRPKRAEGPISMRVVRRGALLAGEVLVPGIVVYEGQD